MRFNSSVELNQHVAANHGRACLLSFSCGKDGVGAYLECRRYFESITPFYLYLVPGLEFVEESLAYYENYFQIRIVRLPHPSLYRLLNNLVFQAPQNIQTVFAADLPDFDYTDIYRVIKEDHALPDDLLTAVGVRAADSPYRGISIRTRGALNEKKGTFYPIYDWNKARLIDEIRRANVRLPIDYKLFGRTFDGLDYRFLRPIKDNFPRDYARILELFPLADIEIFRRERREAYHAKRIAA